MEAGEGCRRRAIARARASVRARAVVVEMVGAGRPNESFSEMGIGAGRSMERAEGRVEKRGQVDGLVWDVMAMRGRAEGRWAIRERSSEVRPE